MLSRFEDLISKEKRLKREKDLFERLRVPVSVDGYVEQADIVEALLNRIERLENTINNLRR